MKNGRAHGAATMMRNTLKLQSIELISRSTQVTARTLLILSSGVFAIFYYELNSTPWDFLGREIRPPEFREIATVIISFLSISHVVHWVSDHTVYTRWFQTNHTTADDIGSIGSFKKSKQAMKDAFVVRLGRIEEQTRALEKSVDRTSKMEGVEERAVTLSKQGMEADWSYIKNSVTKQKEIELRLDEIEAVADDIAPGFKTVSRFANLVIYGWYLFLPLGLSMVSILYMWQEIFPLGSDLSP